MTPARAKPLVAYPTPTTIPTAAMTQIEAAVVRPMMLPRSRRMAPAPKKPHPGYDLRRDA